MQSPISRASVSVLPGTVDIVVSNAGISETTDFVADTELEGPIASLRPQWFGEKNTALTGLQQASTDFRIGAALS